MFAGEANYVPGFIMRKSLTYKILAAVMALSAANWAVPANVLAGEDANGNYNVTYDGETISDSYDSYKNVYGNGYSFTINGGTIDGDVFGVGKIGYTGDGDASGGNVTINGNADVTGNVFGGYSYSREAYDNTVNISGGVVKITRNVYGGYSQNSSAYDNTVNISGNAEVTGYVYGGDSSRSAYNNIVNINGGSVTGEVRGGDSENGEAYDNTVYISKGSVTGNVCGGNSFGGSAYGNIVNISGGSVTNYVYGGKSSVGSAYGNIATLLTSAAVLYQVMFMAAIQKLAVLITT